MGYRDDDVALEARRTALSAEIARLEPQVEALTQLAAKLAALRKERAAIDARLEMRVTTWASGIEWAVVGALLLAMLDALPMGLLPALARARTDQTRSDALAIHRAVLLHLESHPRAACPTVADLRTLGTLHRSRRTTDAWDRPFRIVCNENEVRVISAGPDGVFGPPSTDDIE